MAEMWLTLDRDVPLFTLDKTGRIGMTGSIEVCLQVGNDVKSGPFESPPGILVDFGRWVELLV